MKRPITIPVRLNAHSHNIYLREGLLDETHLYLEQLPFKANRIAVITDSNVEKFCAERAIRSLSIYQEQLAKIVLEAGEGQKSMEGLYSLYETFHDTGLDRDSLIVALGGGVVGDLAGFAASTYLRGVSYIQIPTSLMAQVDSSVGGKTGINLPWGKNLVGAFYQPRFVLIDPELLSTLPQRELCNGLAEVIKVAAIADPKLFAFLEKERDEVFSSDSKLLLRLVRRAVEIKCGFVEQDEKDQGQRMLLNFGHTVGHAIEAVKNYSEVLHGEAVSIGMTAAAILSAELGYCKPADRDRLLKLLRLYELPTQLPSPIEFEKILEAISMDKKRRNGKFRFVVLQGIGKAKVVEGISPAALRRVLAILR